MLDLSRQFECYSTVSISPLRRGKNKKQQLRSLTQKKKEY
jgi:hypothetical protein